MDNGILLPIAVKDEASAKFEKIAKSGAKAAQSLEEVFSRAFGKKWDSLFDTKALSNSAFAMGKVMAKGIIGGIKAGIDISNEVTPLFGKLRMALDPGSSLNEALATIEQAANKARMPLEDMTNVVAKFGLTTGQYFKNDELVQFMETLASYASLTAENPTQALNNAMYQLQQAFSKGRMQMDDLKPIMNQLPGIANDLANGLGVSVAELQSMTSAGLFTSDKIKTAFLGMTQTVEERLQNMPLTLEQRMYGIQNATFLAKKSIASMFKAFGESRLVQVTLGGIELTIKRLVAMMNNFTAVLSKAFGGAKNKTEDLGQSIRTFSNIALIGLTILGGILGILTVKLAIMGTQALISGISATLAFLGFNLTLGQTLLILGGLILVFAIGIKILQMLGISFADVAEVIGGVLGVAIAVVWNLFLGLLDVVLGIINIFGRQWTLFANFFGNIFNDPVASIIYLFRDMGNNILGILKTLASAIDKLFGSNLASAVQGWMNGLDKLADKAANKWGNGTYEATEWKELSSEALGLSRANYGAWASKGAELGRGFGEGVEGALSTLSGLYGMDMTGLGAEDKLSDYDASTGSGSLSTKLDTQTVDELKAFAEVQYRLYYKHITPNVNITFGDVRETVDLDDITAYIKKMMDEDLEELYITEGGQ